MFDNKVYGAVLAIPIALYCNKEWPSKINQSLLSRSNIIVFHGRKYQITTIFRLYTSVFGFTPGFIVIIVVDLVWVLPITTELSRYFNNNSGTNCMWIVPFQASFADYVIVIELQFCCYDNELRILCDCEQIFWYLTL